MTEAEKNYCLHEYGRERPSMQMNNELYKQQFHKNVLNTHNYQTMLDAGDTVNVLSSLY